MDAAASPPWSRTRTRIRTRLGRREAQDIVDRQPLGPAGTARRHADGDDRDQVRRRLDPQELLETRGGQHRRAHPARAVAQRVRGGDQELYGGADALQVGPGAQPVAFLARHAAQREQTVAVRLVGQAEHGDRERRVGEERGVAAQARVSRSRPAASTSGQPAISSRRSSTAVRMADSSARSSTAMKRQGWALPALAARVARRTISRTSSRGTDSLVKRRTLWRPSTAATSPGRASDGGRRIITSTWYQRRRGCFVCGSGVTRRDP